LRGVYTLYHLDSFLTMIISEEGNFSTPKEIENEKNDDTTTVMIHDEATGELRKNTKAQEAL